MSCTLDGQVLQVIGWGWDGEYLGTQTTECDSNSSTVKREIDVVGVVKVHKISCIENGVSWVSSNAKYFLDKVSLGQVLVLNCVLDVYNTGGDVNVKVIGCSGNGSAGGKGEANAGIRYFTIMVQEV